jgi:hypothetical protein
MTAWEDYKKKRTQNLQNGAQVRPTDILDKNNYTDNKTAEARMSICNSCPSLLSVTKQCKECGCFMKIKVKLEQAVCPLGKW